MVIAKDSIGIKTLYAILGCMLVSIFGDYDRYKLKSDEINDEIQELKKYHIYLSIKTDLEEHLANPDVFNGVESQQRVLNINTLDDYSLRDIKIIKRNLRRIEKYSLGYSIKGKKLKP